MEHTYYLMRINLYLIYAIKSIYVFLWRLAQILYIIDKAFFQSYKRSFSSLINSIECSSNHMKSCYPMWNNIKLLKAKASTKYISYLRGSTYEGKNYSN